MSASMGYSFKVYSQSPYPTVSDANANYVKNTNTLAIAATFKDVSGIYVAKATIKDSAGNTKFSNLTMYDDGAHFDGSAYDDKYGIQPIVGETWIPGTYTVYFSAIDGLGNSGINPNGTTFVNFEVSTSATKLSFNISPATVKQGTAVTISATLTDTSLTPNVGVQGKTIAFTDASANPLIIPSATTNASGTVSFSYTVPTNAATGIHNITAASNLSADSLYSSPSAVSAVLTVSPLVDSTQINFSIAPTTSVQNSTVTFSAILKNSNTGVAIPNKTIDFYHYSTKIATGATGPTGEPATAQYFIYANEIPGSFEIKAKYAGDGATYAASEAVQTLNISMSTSLQLSMSSTSAGLSSTITLEANLLPSDFSGVPNQPIEFYDGTTLIATGSTGPNGTPAIANYIIPPGATLGSHTLSAHFNGATLYSQWYGYNVTYAPSNSNSQTLTVYPALIVSATVSPSPISPNKQVTFSATVSGGSGAGTYSYIWAGACSGTGSTCIKSFSTTGSYTATVNVTSGGQTVPASANVVVSSTAPVLSSLLVSPSSLKTGQTVTITPSGQGDNEKDALYLICNETGLNPTISNNLCSQAQAGTSYSSPYAGMTCTYIAPTGSALKSVYCRTYDGFNYSFGTSITSYILDNTAPTGGSITYTSGYFASESVALTVNDGTDNSGGSGINTASRTIQRASTTLVNGTCGTTYGSFATITIAGTYPNFSDNGASSGNCYKYKYIVSDNAGNTVTYTSANVAKVDAIDPSTSDNYEAKDDVWQNTTQTITLTPADTGGSGILSTKYCYDTVNTCTPATTGTSLTVASEGIKYFRYASTDKAGNVQQIVSKKVKIDKTGPTGVTISVSPTTGYVNLASPSALITYNIGSDAVSGINTSSGKIQRASVNLSAGACSGTYVFSDLAVESDGSYTDASVESGKCYKYQYISYNNAGIATTVASATVVKVDTVIPTVSAGPNITRSTQFTQTATASDTASGINTATYKWSKISGPGTITFGTSTAIKTTIKASTSGTYVIQFYVADKAGNPNTSTFTLIW